jgi:hypothetical protein
VTPRRKPAVHIQDEALPILALCGARWELTQHGGRVASSTEPPVVIDEVGSVNAVTCRTCLDVHRRRLRAKK